MIHSIFQIQSNQYELILHEHIIHDIGYQITLITMLTANDRKFLIHCFIIQGTIILKSKMTNEKNKRRKR